MGDLGRRLTILRQRILFTDDPDIGVLQGVFTLLFVLDLTLRAVGGTTYDVGSWPSAGLGLVVVTCVAAVTVPWHTLPAWAIGVLPVLDLAALGMSRMDTEGGGAGILAVVPALWLGRQFGVRGAGAAVVGAVVLIALPNIAYLGLSGVNVSRALMIAVVAGWSALVIAYALDRLRASRDTAEEGRLELAAALEMVENERRFSDAVLDTVDVGLVLLAADGSYRGINRRHEDFMQLAYPDGHQGHAGQLGEVYDADGTSRLRREQMPTYRASQGEEYDDVRMWVGTDLVTRRALSVSARRVRSSNGEFAGAALAYHDVTDFMRALRVKDEFVASVSHELRTPLTSIVGYANILLERDDLPAEVVSQLEVVSRNTDRLNRLVADLLHTAKASAGPMHVVRAPTDLAEVVRNSVEAAGPMATRAGIGLQLAVPESLVAMVDQQRMAQVVDNLLSNGIKYSLPGGLVQVSLGIDADRVELCVIDSGIGISAADRDRLFNRFFRTRQAEERSIQGVGLGLSITKSIVESHGGRIEVESELGRGSVFRVRLPIGG
jgi:two-component system, OmpR family, phosphate regulon sensor histidine kinase PhoR